MTPGRIEQAGTPHEIFDRPVSRFVAGFMGVENLMEARLTGLDGADALVEVDGHRMTGTWSGRTRPAVGDKVVVGMRAERLHIADRPPQGQGLNVLPGRLDSAIYKGKYLDQTVLTDVGPVKVRLWDSSSSTAEQGFVWWKKVDCMVMNA